MAAFAAVAETPPLPALKAYKAPGKRRITIPAPKSGVTVGEHFQVVLGRQNVRPSCALLGKPNVPGYGHWHLFIDTLTKGLATMLAMGRTHTYTADDGERQSEEHHLGRHQPSATCPSRRARFATVRFMDARLGTVGEIVHIPLSPRS